MTRSQLAFIIILNALISLAIALAVVWLMDARRPDPEELASLSTPSAQVALAPTFTQVPGDAPQPAAPVENQPQSEVQPTPAPVVPSGEQTTHVVQAGESVAVIANKYRVTVDAIVSANSLSNPDQIYVGQRLVIPSNGAGNFPVATPTVNAPAATGAGMIIRGVGSPGDLANESVEIVNDSDQPYNLQGWKLQKEGGPAYTFGEMLIFGGQSIRLFSGAGSDDTIKRYWNQPTALWQSGAIIQFVNSQGTVVTSYQIP